MTHHDLKNIGESADEEQVRQMLAGLKQVSAPKDFDFKLKARIAQGLPETKANQVAWSLRYVIPALLIAVVGIIAVTSGLISTGVDLASDQGSRSAPAAAETSVGAESQNQPIVSNLTEPVAVPTDTAPARDALAAARPAINRPGARRAAPASVRRGGGSIDVGTSVEEPIFPKGLDPNTPPVRVNEKTVQSGPLQTKVILGFLGIDAAYDGTNWKASSVKQHSIGERAGIKAGDIIEAVNDMPVGQSTEFRSPFSGKSITVNREGKSVKLGLSP